MSAQNFLLVLALFAIISSCSKAAKIDPIDKTLDLTYSDFQKGLIKKPKKNNTTDSSFNQAVPLPKISRMIVTPLPPKIGGQKLISFSVNDDVNLKDVLTELGRLAGLDVDIDPNISGGVIINAKNRPFKEVIDRICDMGNVRYSYSNGVLHFQKDSPYLKHYVVDYLLDGSLWNEVQTVINGIISGGDGSPTASYNKAAGIITVYASEKKQKEVEKYLQEVSRNSSGQVLIEAKIIEVTLSNQYQTGINWSWISKGGGTQVNPGSSAGTLKDDAKIFTLNSHWFLNGNLSGAITALEQFGTIRAIASPRLNALNNQKANLNFIDKLVYFTTQVETNQISTTNSTGNGLNQTVTSEKHEEPVGTELTIIPSINLKTREVTLDVTPKLSVKSGEVTDPTLVPTGTNGALVPVNNKIPTIQTRELHTTVKVESGGTLVIGGLMKEDSSNTNAGTPFLQRIPVLGNLFKSTDKNSKVVETVILIKASIIDSGSGTSKEDRSIQEKFDSNIRPFF